MNSAVQRVQELDAALFSHIETQTTDDERRSLLAVQRATAARHGSYTYLEIGSHLGGSIQPHLVDPRCARIFSIDPRPRQQPDDRAEGYVYTYENNSTARMLELLQSVDREQVAKITCFDSDASAVDPSAVSPPANLVLIDGEHTRRAVLSDFAACSLMLTADATVLFHDYGIIAPAVEEICAALDERGRPYVGMRLEGSLFALFLDPGTPLSDPHIKGLYQLHARAQQRRRLRSFFRAVTPAPLWRALGWLKRTAGS